VGEEGRGGRGVRGEGGERKGGREGKRDNGVEAERGGWEEGIGEVRGRRKGIRGKT